MADLNLQSQKAADKHFPTIWGRLQYWLFEPATSIKRQDDRRQARLLSTIQFALICLNFIVVLLPAPTTVSSPILNINIIMVVLLIIYGLGRTRHYWIAAFILILAEATLPFV